MTYRQVKAEVDDPLILTLDALGPGGGLLLVGLPERDGEALPALAEELRLVRPEQPDLPLLGRDGSAIVKPVQTLDAVSLFPLGALPVSVRA